MYFVDFFKNLTKKSNIGVFIWLILNTIIVSSILAAFFTEMVNGNMVSAYLLGIAAYIVILAITLSPIGEWILRMQNGCKKIERKEYIERLEPIFREVYAKAKEQNPELPDDIQFYMCEDDMANAFATGRKTVCITEGLMRYPDRHIRAVLAHEFGHLAHKDTDAVLIVAVGNLIVSAIFVIYRVLFRIVAALFSFIMAFFSEDAGMAIGSAIINIFVDFILAILMQAWTKLGVLICLYSSRKNENLADEYAYNLGYGVELCEFLDHLAPAKSKGLWAALNSSHPDHDVRISYLQNLGCTYRK